MPSTSTIPPYLPTTELPGLKLLRRGKVRDVYEVDAEKLLLVSTDRVSAFDYVLSPAIPYKGAVLNGISAWWFRRVAEEFGSHFLTDRVEEMPPPVARHGDTIRGRAVLCRRAKIVPYECVVRGYLAGSAVKEYHAEGTVGGQRVSEGKKPGDKLDLPLFTPTTKAETGHDEPVTLDEMRAKLGAELAEKLAQRSVALFAKGSIEAERRGLVLVDTKFEWGIDDAGRLLLCDEIFTPDSSRYWLAEERKTTQQPEPLDKQVVRNYLLKDSGWDQKGGAPPPPLPPHIVVETTSRYLRLFEILTGGKL